MKPADIDYARDIFAELVVAVTLQSGRPPSSEESEALSAEAIDMANTWATVQQRSLPTSPPGADLDSAPNAAPTLLPSFAQVLAEWFEKGVKRTAGKSRQGLKSVFRRYVLPQLGPRAMSDVEPADILSILRSMESAGHFRMAYATFRDFRFLYRYALAAGLTNYDPTAVLRRAITTPRRKGTSMITDPESVGCLLQVIRRYKGSPRSTVRYLLRLLPMLFLRASELRTLEWRDIDLDAATAVIPAERMKMRRPHVVPLARQAVRVLREVQKITGRGRYVFTSGRIGDKPLDFSIFHSIFRGLGYRGVVSPQGFRVLASTWLNELGWPAEIIERQLSHLGTDRTRRIYNHAEYLADRRRLMQAWADHLDSLDAKAKRPLNDGRAFNRRYGVRHAAV